MANSRARAAVPSIARNFSMKHGTSRHGIAARCLTRRLRGAASKYSRWPLQRAGLSPVRYPATVAQSKIASIRPRKRAPVSGALCHTFSRAFTTIAVSMVETGSEPKTEKTCLVRLRGHSCACCWLRHSSRCAAMYACAAASNVVDFMLAAAAVARWALRCCNGSTPRRRSAQYSRASSRASLRPRMLRLPRPISIARPLVV